MHPNEYARRREAGLDCIAVTISEAQRVSGFSRSAIYRELAAGNLKAVKLGSSTLVLMDSIRERLTNLPPATFRPVRAA